MKVVLLVDVKPHGKKGDIVEVNDGFARNFLLPKKKAIVANAEVINNRKQNLANEAKKKAEEKAEALELYNAINKSSIDVPVRCGNGKLYGSVTNQDVADALKAKGFEIDKRNVKIKENIRELGNYEIEVKCYTGYLAVVTLNIISSDIK
ncbi:MAG: 50S ribosomal protein L9 [Clostridia bacterium]